MKSPSPSAHKEVNKDVLTADIACCPAALVIQGSACVYSRKVEYLHTLVHQALAYVADKKCAGPQV